MTKEKLAIEVIKRLKAAYPRTDCTLEYDEAWKLLVSVRLAAQCTDARVNVVVVDLFKKYPSIFHSQSLHQSLPHILTQSNILQT